MRTHYGKESGLSLIELMIAITLSLVLTLGVIEIFDSSRQTNRTQGALGGIQENARFALDQLGYDLRMAGNIGCNRTASITNIQDNTNVPDVGAGIQGYEYGDTLPAVLLLNDGKSKSKNPNKTNSDTSIVAGTDTVVVRYASPNSINVATSNLTSITLTATPADTIEAGEPLIVSDCQSADIFIPSAIKNKTITLNDKQPLSKVYGKDATVAPLKYTAYYIRKYKGSDGITRNNLYKSSVSKTTSIDTDPLLEGVEDMEILYGETLANGNVRYVDANAAGLDMNRVTSIRVSLLFGTIDNNLASGDQNYWFNGEPVNVKSADNKNKKLYRGFTTTIKLRNRDI